MKNVRLYQILVILLVILNLATLAFMWFNRPGRERPVGQQGPASFLIRELNLSGSQQKEYMSLRREHREMLKKLSERDQGLHKRFFDLFLLDSPDTINMEALADSIAANRKKMEVITYDHFYRVSKMLDPEQQKKFTIIFQDVLKMVLPPPPPPPNDAPPPPPPGPVPEN